VDRFYTVAEEHRWDELPDGLRQLAERLGGIDVHLVPAMPVGHVGVVSMTEDGPSLARLDLD
jgi:hypothetical protein